MDKLQNIIGRIFRHSEPEPMSEFMIAFGNIRLTAEIILDCVDYKINELNRILNLAHICIENTFSGEVQKVLNELMKLQHDILDSERKI